MKITVIGGTGLIGSRLVANLVAHGHEAIPASPDTGVNTLTGEGLGQALAGADVAVDVSNSPSFEDAAVLEFFEFAIRMANKASDGHTVQVPAALIQPMAADDVAAAVCDVALGAPRSSTIEIAGTEPMRFGDFVERQLRAAGDQRVVITDPQARYFGAQLSERTLLPGDGAQLGVTTFSDWLSRLAPGQ